MAVVNPPLHLTRDGATADIVRRFNMRMAGDRPGVFGPNDFQVTQMATPTMAVVVSPGAGIIRGTESDAQGAYYVEADSDTQLPLTPSDTVNDRFDLVVARILDSDYSGSLDMFSLEIVQGTPAVNPVIPPVPNNCLVLARVLVEAGTNAITSARIVNLQNVFADNDQAGFVSSLGGTVVCTSSTRPVAGRYEGLTVYETDTKRSMIWTGAGWELLAPVMLTFDREEWSGQVADSTVLAVDRRNRFVAPCNGYFVVDVSGRMGFAGRSAVFSAVVRADNTTSGGNEDNYSHGYAPASRWTTVSTRDVQFYNAGQNMGHSISVLTDNPSAASFYLRVNVRVDFIPERLYG